MLEKTSRLYQIRYLTRLKWRIYFEYALFHHLSHSWQDGTPLGSFWYVAVLLFSPIGVERKSVKCKDRNLEFIYLAQTSVSNILSLSTRSNFFWSWNRVHLFCDKDRYWRSDSTYAFFLSSSDKAISRGTVNFRYFNFTCGQIEGIDYCDS